MMKPWSRLCFLVLVISALARGQDGTTVPHDNGHDDETVHPDPSSGTPAPLAPPETLNQTISPNTSADVTTVPTTSTTDNLDSTENMSEKEYGTMTAQTTTTDMQSTVPTMTMAQTTQKPVVKGSSNNVGYVVLVLIIIVIIVLCVILYFLRRVSRSYSFDLQRPVHNHLDEPTGTFEPVYLDDLDITAPKDQMTTDDLSPPPAANGTTVQSEETASNGDNAPQEQPEANGLEISLTSNTSPSLDNDPADKTPSPLSTSNLFLDATGEEQQNENNNNPSVCSSDPFVEINLDDPAWSDQLLTSPEASSSVLPFSPFSFSSSSS